jgi:hypothetical protein
MSKTSKPGDLWRQVYAAAANRPDTWCNGCGYFRVVNGVHRADCTAPNRPRPAPNRPRPATAPGRRERENMTHETEEQRRMRRSLIDDMVADGADREHFESMTPDHLKSPLPCIVAGMSPVEMIHLSPTRS